MIGLKSTRHNARWSQRDLYIRRLVSRDAWHRHEETARHTALGGDAHQVTICFGCGALGSCLSTEDELCFWGCDISLGARCNKVLNRKSDVGETPQDPEEKISRSVRSPTERDLCISRTDSSRASCAKDATSCRDSLFGPLQVERFELMGHTPNRHIRAMSQEVPVTVA